MDPSEPLDPKINQDFANSLTLLINNIIKEQSQSFVGPPTTQSVPINQQTTQSVPTTKVNERNLPICPPKYPS
jgi:hypothetical protein